MIKTTKIALSMLAVGAMALSTHADPITGSVSFDGVVQMDAGAQSGATEVLSWGNITVGVGTGSFQNLLYGTPVNFNAPLPWQFNSAPNASPINNFWTIGGQSGILFSFTLDSSSIKPGSTLEVDGIGYLSGQGYDNTPATIEFTTQGNDATVTFSTTTSAVPEAGTTAVLLGCGLMGLFIFSKVRKQAVA